MAKFQDVVGVFDANGNQQFTRARSMRLQVSLDAKTMAHPLENGTSVVDHLVILPGESTLLVVMQASDYRDAYSQIRSLFMTGTLLTLQCKVDSYPNMYIGAMHHEEIPDMADAVQLVLRMTEASFFKSQATASRPRRSRSGPTIRRGEQSGKPKNSTLYNIFGK